MNRLRPADAAQLVAVALLAIAIFLPWYSTEEANPNAFVEGNRGDITIWEAHPVLRWVVVAAVVAGLLSAWQTIRAHEPQHGWQRGEMSIVVAALLTGLVLYVGLIDRPGEPSEAIDLAYGWFVVLAACLIGLVAASMRLPQARRAPPGV